jgi:hypothetical protein
MSAKLLQVTVTAEAFGELWAEGEASKSVSLTMPGQEFGGSLRAAIHKLREKENRGGDFQPGSVRLEAVAVHYSYRKGRVVHSVTCDAPEATVEAVNA